MIQLIIGVLLLGGYIPLIPTIRSKLNIHFFYLFNFIFISWIFFFTLCNNFYPETVNNMLLAATLAIIFIVNYESINKLLE